MNYLKIATIAASLAGAAAIAAPAQATTFADFAAANSATNISYVGGHLTGSGETKFSFLTLSHAFRNLAADFTISATTTAAPVGVFGYDVQPGLNGTFSFTYDGPSITGLATGTTLLSGVFTGASLAGPDGGSTGSLQDAIVSGGTVTFSSPELSFMPAGDKGLSLSMTSLLPGLIVNHHALHRFTAVSTGSFAADLAGAGGGGGVPEPASWALMLLGFGGIGIARRSTLARRNAVA